MSETNQAQQVADVGGYQLAEQVTGLCRGTLYALVNQRRIPHIACPGGLSGSGMLTLNAGSQSAILS